MPDRARDTSVRARCPRCLKPERLCICAQVPRVANRTAILVLQHARERFHSVGTARIVKLGLEQAECIETSGESARPPSLGARAALLYPGPDSRELGELRPDESPQQLVVLDGSWRQARLLFRRNAWVRELPRVRLSPTEPSRYRGLRRQPAAHCLSTLESVLAALAELEPQTRGFDGLLAAFDALLASQAPFSRRPDKQPRRRLKRRRESRAIPAELRAAAERVVFIYAETVPAAPSADAEERADDTRDAPRSGARVRDGALAPERAATRSEGREGVHARAREAAPRATGEAPPGPPPGARRLVRWSAWRPADGAHFDRLVRPTGPAPLPAHLAHMEIDPRALARAATLPELATSWRAFRRAGEPVLAWHPAVLTILRWFDSSPPASFALRTLWANHRHGKPGRLEDVVATLPANGPTPKLAGRAGHRLAHAALVWRVLVEARS